MTTEVEFVQARLQIISERLDEDDSDIEPMQRLRMEREQRLLRRVKSELPEGEVLQTLKDWRTFLGFELQDHKIATRAQMRKYERWRRLSRSQREVTPQPERPPIGTTSTDKNGDIWVIDDRFLAMMDDLIKRLQKWLET